MIFSSFSLPVVRCNVAATRTPILSLSAFLFFLLFAVSSFAQTDSLRQTILNPVVVTGTGTYHRAENSPVSVKVLSAKDLKDAQVTSLEEALTRLSSSVTTHTNGMGTFLNFGGVSDDYIVILENGKRISGDDRWQRISMDNVKRIEIYNGAASALYGSDAIAGVINIITDDSKAPLSASYSTKLRNHGRLDEDINVDVNAGGLSSQTSYTHRQADNWQVNSYQAFDEDGTQVLKLTGRPMSTGFHSHNISENLNWKLNDQWSVYVRGSFYDYRSDRPQSAYYFTQKKVAGAYTYPAKQAYTYDLHHRSYTYGMGARWSPNARTFVYLDVFSDNFSSKYDYWQTSENLSCEQTRKRTHYVSETLRGIFRLTSWNKLSAGIECVQESLSSQSDDIDFETTNTYNVFAQDELRIAESLDGVVGLRFTHNGHFGTALTHNLGLFYHVGGLRLRANYASAYRTPSLSQLYATDQAKTAVRFTLSNTDLDPERSGFLNINAEYATSWMSVSVTGFLNRIRDMINYRTLAQAEIDGSPELTALQAEGWGTIRQRDNIDKATIKGITTSVKFLLPGGLTIGGGYSFTDASSETQSLDKKTQQVVTTVRDVDKSVRHVGSFLAAWDRTWGNYHLNISLNGHFQGRRFSTTYGYAPACSQWDLLTRHSIRMRHATIEPTLGIENLLNQRDNSFWNSNFSTVTPGRTYVIGMRMRY